MGCEGKLVFMDHRDAESARVVESPTYVEELPNERDVAAHLGIYRRMADWTGMALPATEVRESEREFRETPKMWFLRGNALVFNGQDRLWVATNRDRDTFSYFDIWVGTGYDGTVQIRDRLMGFDLLGSTLVALVERKPGPDGKCSTGHRLVRYRWTGVWSAERTSATRHHPIGILTPFTARCQRLLEAAEVLATEALDSQS